MDFDVPSAISNNEDGTTPSAEDNLRTSKPHAIYGTFFWLHLNNEQKCSDSKIFNCGIDSTNLTSQVTRAVTIFNTMFPGEECLPKPPDPEENDDNDTEDISTLQNEEPSVAQPDNNDNDQLNRILGQ